MSRWRHQEELDGETADGPAGEAERRVSERAAFKGLDAVYRKAASVLAGFTCAVSGDCCQLARTRREPYLFPIELMRVERALARAGRTMPGPRADGGCRLLEAGGRRCSIYADRPFGCRTFFCERLRGPKPMPVAELHRLTAQLTRVSDALDPGAEPRAISELLDGREPGREGRGSHDEGDGRDEPVPPNR